MGVDLPNVKEVIHISPPSNIENYVQEIGRAGRSGSQSFATLYYNNSDIASNITHIDKNMKQYCRETLCLRKYLMNYFEFQCATQKDCCSNCNAMEVEEEENNFIEKPFRELRITTELFSSLLNDAVMNFSSDDLFNFYSCVVDVNCVIENVGNIKSQKDLLRICSIWDENLSKVIFEIIENNTTVTN